LKRGTWFGIALGVIALLFAGATLLRRRVSAGPSSLARDADGWLAARTYLERHGHRAPLSDRPLDRAPEGDVLVLAFPTASAVDSAQLAAVKARLSRGGAVVFGYSGQEGVAETEIARELGLSFRKNVRGRPPLNPVRWYAYASETWTLAPDPDLGPLARPVVVSAPRQRPEAPSGARILYRGPGGVPAAFEVASGHGRLFVIPADALSNGRLGNPGNADLLESLSASLGHSIVFDEYHHGLVALDITAESGSVRSLDLLLVQLVLLYLLAAWALAKRFGPAWREPTPIASSTTTFLRGLGELHRRLGHSGDAALRLVESAEALDPRLAVPAAMRRAAAQARPDDLVKIAQTVSRLQGRRRAD
jgi:Domain of unknown function (DUF4350)